MNKNQRIRYHAELWPAACEAQGWNPKDDALRRAMVTQCLIDIGVLDPSQLSTLNSQPVSSSALDEAQITALFLFLQHLGAPNHIGLAQEWDHCRAGYIAFHKSKQADWHQRRAYGRNGGGHLTRNRFAGRRTAKPAPFDIDGPLSEKEANDRLMTMRSHARKRAGSTPRPRRPAEPDLEQADLIPAPPKPDPYAAVDAALGYDRTVEEPMPF